MRRKTTLRLAWLLTCLLALTLALAGCGKAKGPSKDADGQVTVTKVEADVEEVEDEVLEAPELRGGSSRAATEADDRADEAGQGAVEGTNDTSPPAAAIDENGTYTSKDEVALYLNTYGHLPSNYVTKDEAEDAGWKSRGKTLDKVLPGMSIGGDRFGNREGKLPKASGRTWRECDIDYHGGSRNAKRIVYSSDGLIYYTDNHYKSFERLY